MRKRSRVGVHALLVMVGLTVPLAACSGSSKGGMSGPEALQLVQKGGSFNPMDVSCAGLQYLARKYGDIGDSASRGASYSSSAAGVGIALQATQAYGKQAEMFQAMAAKGC